MRKVDDRYELSRDGFPDGLSPAARRQRIYRRRKRMVDLLKKCATEERLWEAILLFQGYPFETAKGLQFTYRVKKNKKGCFCNEIVVDRKEKSITRSSIELAFSRAQEMGTVAGPKQLGVFGASYLYPIFVRMGVLETGKEGDSTKRVERIL